MAGQCFPFKHLLGRGWQRIEKLFIIARAGLACPSGRAGLGQAGQQLLVRGGQQAIRAGGGDQVGPMLRRQLQPAVAPPALDLCMVAAGRLDVYYEHGLQVWDWAAGALIAAEAGALVVLPEKGGSGGGGGLLVAAAPGVATQLIETLDRFSGLRPIE